MPIGVPAVCAIAELPASDTSNAAAKPKRTIIPSSALQPGRTAIDQRPQRRNLFELRRLDSKIIDSRNANGAADSSQVGGMIRPS